MSEILKALNEQAKKANWPCEWCEVYLGSNRFTKACQPGQCQSKNRRVKGLKPLNFKLETRTLISSSWGVLSTNCVKGLLEKLLKQREDSIKES